MKLRIPLLAFRAAALIVATGFIAVNLRDYLGRHWHVPISGPLYGVLGLLLIWIVAWLSTRGLLRELRVDAGTPQQPATNDPVVSTSAAVFESVHRYPSSLRYLCAVLGLFLLALPYLSVGSGNTIPPVTFIVCFGCACIVFAIDFYLFSYSVRVHHNGIVIRAFGKREISFSEISDIRLVKTKIGQQIVVALKGGQVVRLGGMLAHFSAIWNALAQRVPRTG